MFIGVTSKRPVCTLKNGEMRRNGEKWALVELRFICEPITSCTQENATSGSGEGLLLAYSSLSSRRRNFLFNLQSSIWPV